MYVRKDAPKCLVLRLLPYRGTEGSSTASQMTRADSRGRPANRPSLGCPSCWEIGDCLRTQAGELVSPPSRSAAKTRLLAALPGPDRQRLLARSQQVELRLADV